MQDTETQTLLDRRYNLICHKPRIIVDISQYIMKEISQYKRKSRYGMLTGMLTADSFCKNNIPFGNFDHILSIRENYLPVRLLNHCQLK